MRPNCKKCATPLTGEVDTANITTCPNCGKRWELTADQTAIKSTTIVVQDAALEFVSTFKGVRNG